MPTRPPIYRPPFLPTYSADRLRGPSSKRGYDGAWRRARDAYLAEHPCCEVCEARGRTTAATIVDHRTPIVIDPSRRLDPTNFRSCCVDCHAEITTNFKLTGTNEPKETKA